MIALPSRGIIFMAGLALGLGIGAWGRTVLAELEMAQYQARLEQQAADQRELKAKVEASQVQLQQQSSERLDQQQTDQQKEIVYVDKEVIRYRDRWRESACRLPAEWLRLYNRSLGHLDAVPESAAVRP